MGEEWTIKFVASFSGGKDSVLALHEMAAAGHESVALLVMYQPEAGRSWVHGIGPQLLAAISDALEIPLLCCEADTENYNERMEWGLCQARQMGAEACVFGDIDTALHRQWDEARCAAAGLKAVLPLWGRDRLELVRRTLDLDYRCLIKCVRIGVLPESWLGEELCQAHVEQMLAMGVDACGENGEYHTVVVEGPLFHHPVLTINRGPVRLEYVVAADLTLAGNESS